MPNLDATLWNDLQVTGATNEKRFQSLGLLDAAKDSTPFVDYIPPSAKEAMRKASSLHNTIIPVLRDQTITVTPTPGFAFIPSNLPQSDTYYFQGVNVFTGFRHYPAQFDNNQMDEEWTKKEVMRNVAHAAGSYIEGLIASVLESRKTQLLDFTTQVAHGSGTYTFDAPSDTLQIDIDAQNETMFFSLKKLMTANRLGGEYRIITSPGGLARQIANAIKYGAGNQQNIAALQLLPPNRVYESHNIDVEDDIFNGWFIRDGAIGLIENFPYDFRNGTEIAGRKWSISDMEIPYTRMKANVYVNNEATDATALVSSGTDTNLIMTTFQEMAIWFRFYIVYRYNSDLATRANDIVKIQGLTT